MVPIQDKEQLRVVTGEDGWGGDWGGWFGVVTAEDGLGGDWGGWLGW